MADFSINATSLTPPQGAGTSPIEPVPAIKPIETGAMHIVSTIADVFEKGLTATRKEDALKRQQTIVNSYIKEETTLNDAVASGQMTPAAAAARSRATFSKYAAGYGEYIGEFEKAGKALRGFTELGQVEDQLKTEKARRDADMNDASSKGGFTFFSGMSQQAEDSQIQAYKTGLRASVELEKLHKANAEKRAQGTYDAGVAAKEERDTGIKLVNSIAGDNFTAFQDFSKSLGDTVRSGKMNSQEALAQLNSRYANINAAIQSAASANPELAAPYRSLFKDVYDIGQKLLDPKEDATALQAQLEKRTTQMKLVAMSDPKIAATVVANQLLPNNVNLALSSAPEGVRAIAILSNTPVGESGYTPQVVGNPDAEPDTLKLLKGGLNDLFKGQVSNKELGDIQASNSVNHILKQTGDMLNKGASPQQLKGVASFFASTEYANFVKSGQIDPQSAGAAKKAFQMLYEPAIIKGVQERLSQDLYNPSTMGMALGGGAGTEAPKTPTKVSEAIDIKFSGSGVVFAIKAAPGLAPIELQAQQQALRNLKSAQAGINQLIHIGAHMEGSTDYGTYWENNKHIYLPSIFPDPVQLKPGATVDGYQYLGGAYNDRRNWKQVKP